MTKENPNNLEQSIRWRDLAPWGALFLTFSFVVLWFGSPNQAAWADTALDQVCVTQLDGETVCGTLSDPQQIERIPSEEYRRLKAEMLSELMLVLEDQYQRDRALFEYQIWVFGLLATVFLAAAVWGGYGRMDDVKTNMTDRFEDLKRSLSGSISEVASAQVDKRATEINEVFQRISKREVEFNRTMRLYDFKTVAREMAQGDSFSNSQLDDALELIEEFQEDIRKGKLVGAGKSLHSVSEALYQAARWDALEKIENWFPALTKSDSGLRNLMLQTSMHMVFRHDADPEALAKGREYAKAAWDSGQGETALPLELMFLYKEEQDSEERRKRAARMLRHAKDFKPDGEMIQFLNAVGSMMAPEGLSLNPSEVHKEIAAYGRALFEDFAEDFEYLISLANPAVIARLGDQADGIAILFALLAERVGSNLDIDPNQPKS